MSLVSINWNPDKKELKKFGISMWVGFGILGIISLFILDKSGLAYFCWIFGIIAGGLGLSQQKIALPVYWAWMAIAFVMGNIISRVLVVLFYYLMITPIGIIMRLSGRDKLKLKKPDSDTYWVDAPAPQCKERFERQF